VKRRTAQREVSARDASPGPPDDPEIVEAVDSRDVLADAALARRCVAGEVAAWEQLYALCHLPLLAAVESLLRAPHRDAALIDEIAARVWYALVDNDGELLEKFDPARGARLITFMRALAKDEISRHFRGERRRRARESSAVHERTQQSAAEARAHFAEFLSTLTPHERQFASDYLLSNNPVEDCPPKKHHSPANIWQLTRRIHRKLLGYLGKKS